MAIQVRRGNEADFDASKMMPGEWAVSLDTKYVRMCFAPGIVLRMASYESFEADMELIQGILEECEEIQTAIERIKSEIDEKASLTIEYSNSASLSATRASEEADRAHEEAERAKNYADSAQSATNVQIATKDTAGIIKGGDNYIAEDGTLTLIVETTETTMPNSCEGRLLFKEIRGKTEQGANPTPTNPQEIRSVSISGIKTHSKNMLNPSLQTITYNGVTCTRNSDGTYTLNGTATAKAAFTVFYNSNGAFNGKTVKAVGCPKGGSDASYKVWFTDVTVLGDNDLGNGAILTPSTNELKYIIEIGNGYTCSNLVFKPMITTDLEATYDDFEPYGVSSFTFSKPIELNKIGDVQDVIVDGEITKRLGRIVFDGSDDEGFAYDKSNNRITTHIIDSIVKCVNSNETKANILSSALVTKSLNEAFSSGEGIAISTIGVLSLLHPSLTSLEAWKVHLQANPMTLVYELAAPITEALPLADQVALNSIKTFDGTTYLEFDSPLKPEFVAEYGTSKVGGVALESLLVARNNEIRISALETSAVNNI